MMENEFEVLRVIRVPPLGALTVHADGLRYTQIGAVKNDKVRQRLLAAIGELVSFAGGYDALVSAGFAPPLPSKSGAVASAGEDNEEELRRKQAEFLEQLERNARGNVAPDLYRSAIIPGESGRPTLAADPLESPINLVDEIDQILQRHLAANDQLAQRSISLRQAHGEQLQIVVDGRVFRHPNEIEDEEVKKVLKQALKEWEAR